MSRKSSRSLFALPFAIVFLLLHAPQAVAEEPGDAARIELALPTGPFDGEFGHDALTRLKDTKRKSKFRGIGYVEIEEDSRLPVDVKLIYDKRKSRLTYRLTLLPATGKKAKRDKLTVLLKVREESLSPEFVRVDYKPLFGDRARTKRKPPLPGEVTFAYVPLIPPEAVLSGTAQLPELPFPSGDLDFVVLLDLEGNELQRHAGPDAGFAFTVPTQLRYQLYAAWQTDQWLGAITPTINGDTTQDIDLDSELALNLITVTEGVPDDFLPQSLSAPLGELLDDANECVRRIQAFIDDRNGVQNADRVADAVRNLTLDQLTRASTVFTDQLVYETLRAYGAGLDPLRSLDEMVSDPVIPLNPQFIFSRFNDNGEPDFGMSDLERKRWDLIEENAAVAHMVTGGEQVVYLKATTNLMQGPNRYSLGVWKRSVTDATAQPELLTPDDLDCETPALSPDEKFIAFAGRSVNVPDLTKTEAHQFLGPYDIYVMEVDGSNLTQLTFDTGGVDDARHGNLSPSWHPDGTRIVFEHVLQVDPDTRTQDRLEIIDADGMNRTTYIDGQFSGIRLPGSPKWSPDGDRMVFHGARNGSGETDLEILVGPAGPPVHLVRFLTDNDADDGSPSWSYTGRYIMYVSAAGGEPGGIDGNGFLFPIQAIDSVTEENVASLGDFTGASLYAHPHFVAIPVALVVQDNVPVDSDGEAVVTPGADPRSNSSHSTQSVHRAIQQAAASIGISYNGLFP